MNEQAILKTTACPDNKIGQLSKPLPPQHLQCLEQTGPSKHGCSCASIPQPRTTAQGTWQTTG
eukprot:498828-Pelagomonas_calceolata.AAC.7